MSEQPDHPYRTALQAELTAISEEVLAHLDRGHEMPFGPEIIEEAARRCIYHRAQNQAAKEGHWLTAWLLGRLA